MQFGGRLHGLLVVGISNVDHLFQWVWQKYVSQRTIMSLLVKRTGKPSTEFLEVGKVGPRHQKLEKGPQLFRSALVETVLDSMSTAISC